MTFGLSIREKRKDSQIPFLTVSKLLTNVVKHSSVRDDGRGFDPAKFGESLASESALKLSSLHQQIMSMGRESPCNPGAASN